MSNPLNTDYHCNKKTPKITLLMLSILFAFSLPFMMLDWLFQRRYFWNYRLIHKNELKNLNHKRFILLENIKTLRCVLNFLPESLHDSEYYGEYKNSFEMARYVSNVLFNNYHRISNDLDEYAGILFVNELGICPEESFLSSERKEFVSYLKSLDVGNYNGSRDHLIKTMCVIDALSLVDDLVFYSLNDGNHKKWQAQKSIDDKSR